MTDAPDLSLLLAACAQGDRRAFKTLYDSQSPQLYGIALRITRDAALAADALHDALLQAWYNAARYDAARGRAEAWLISLVRYRALDLVRSRKRETVTDQPPEQVDDSPDAFENVSREADARALQRCLETLEVERRRVIASAFIDGYSHAELAKKLNVPLGTVKSWIRRGLESLRKCLES